MRSIVRGASATLLGVDLAEPARRGSVWPPPDPDGGQLGLDGLRGGLLDLGDRHLLPALLAAPLLAGHPRVDVEPGAAALTEKHDAHRADSLIAGHARARSNAIVFTSVSSSEDRDEDAQQQQRPEYDALVEPGHQFEVNRGEDQRLNQPGLPERDPQRLAQADLHVPGCRCGKSCPCQLTRNARLRNATAAV